MIRARFSSGLLALGLLLAMTVALALYSFLPTAILPYYFDAHPSDQHVVIDYGPFGMPHVWPPSENDKTRELHNCLTSKLETSALDSELLHTFASATINQIELLNRVSYKVRFSNGIKAAFKIYGGTEEDHSMSLIDHVGWNDQGFSEIAAFHIDRILGINRAPIVVGRALPLAELKRITDPKYHHYLDRCAYDLDGVELVRGAMVEWMPLSAPHGITQKQLDEIKILRKGISESNNVPAEQAANVNVPRKMINTLFVFDFLLLNEDRSKSDNFFLQCPEDGVQYSEDSKIADLLNAGCVFIHLDNGLGLYEIGCNRSLSDEEYLRHFQSIGSRPHRLLYVTRPLRNCVYEENILSNIRTARDSLGQKLLESLTCDAMSELGDILPYYPQQCYAQGLNRRAHIVDTLATMCQNGAAEGLIPLP